MSLSNFFIRFGLMSDALKDGAKYNIYSSKKFRKIIEREHACADRGGLQFSVLDFNIGNTSENGAFTVQLIEILSKRLRLTDEIGWVDDQHLGALLYNTNAIDAGIFANKILDFFSHIASPMDYNVYTYPSYNNTGQNNGNRGKQRAMVSGQPKGNDPEDFLNFQQEASRNKETANSHLSSIGSEDKAIPVQHFKPLASVKMPVWKRSLDIIGALFGLAILSPVFLLIGLIIKTVSPGPLFFKQERIGYGGNSFTLLKFRTMKMNADSTSHQNYYVELINGDTDVDKPMAKLDDQNPQIILFGKMLRKTYIDELPQLINVLHGEMSLVGPRPPIPYEVSEYLRWHNSRLNAVPGMTGLWQTSGKNRLSFKEMVRMDIRYSRKLSFLSDMKILLLTPLVIITELIYSR